MDAFNIDGERHAYIMGAIDNSYMEDMCLQFKRPRQFIILKRLGSSKGSGGVSSGDRFHLLAPIYLYILSCDDISYDDSDI